MEVDPFQQAPPLTSIPSVMPLVEVLADATGPAGALPMRTQARYKEFYTLRHMDIFSNTIYLKKKK